MTSFGRVIKLFIFELLIVTKITQTYRSNLCYCEHFYPPNNLFECINPTMYIAFRSRLKMNQATDVKETLLSPNCIIYFNTNVSTIEIEEVNIVGQKLSEKFFSVLDRTFRNARLIVLHNSSLNKIPDLKSLSKLVHLDLSANRLKDLRDSNELNPNLIELLLNDNTIESISWGYFRRLTRLKFLNLENNRLVNLSLYFNFLPTSESKSLLFARNSLFRNNKISFDIEVNKSRYKSDITRIKIDVFGASWSKFPSLRVKNAQVEVLASYHDLKRPDWMIPSYIVKFETNSHLSYVNISGMRNTAEINQLLFAEVNLHNAPLYFNLEKNGFVELPDITLLYGIKFLNMRENRLFSLNRNVETLPKLIEVLDFRCGLALLPTNK